MSHPRKMQPIGNIEKEFVGNDEYRQTDRPDYRSGDVIIIDHVYGQSGPGFGVFVAYSTDGTKAIVNFDGDTVTVPIRCVTAATATSAEQAFLSTGNDGSLSPMSFGDENKTIIDFGDDKMDEFSKWMAAMDGEMRSEPQGGICDCGEYDCEVCFPDEPGMDQTGAHPEQGEARAAVVIGGEEAHCPACGQEIKMGGEDHGHEDEGELSFSLDDEPSILLVGEEEDTDYPYSPDEQGEYSPMSMMDEEEEDPPDATGGYHDFDPSQQQDMGGEFDDSDDMGLDGPEDMSELISKIDYLQDLGLSNTDKHYSPAVLQRMSPEAIRRVYQKVSGESAEMGESMYEEEDTGADETVLEWIDRFKRLSK